MDFEYVFPTDCNSLGTIVQSVPSTELHIPEEVIEMTTQNELPIIYQSSIQSDGQLQNEPEQIPVESHHIVSSGGQRLNENEEILYDGMIDLSNASDNQTQIHILEVNPSICNDVSTNSLYMEHELETKREIEHNPSSLVIHHVQQHELNEVVKETAILSNINLELDDESQNIENCQNVIRNNVAIQKPESFVPNLLVPFLATSSARKSAHSSINSFYLKVSEDECFEGHFPSSSKDMALSTFLDDRINNEYDQSNSDTSAHTKFLAKKHNSAKRKLSSKEKVNQRKIRILNNSNNNDISNGRSHRIESNIVDNNTNPHNENTDQSLNLSASANKPQLDTNASLRPSDATHSKGKGSYKQSSPPSTIQVPKVPKSGDEWYELPDGWRKRAIQRKSGSSMGGWDVYLHPPVPGKRLRSSTELMRFVKDHPEMPIDPMQVNMDLPFKMTADGKPSLATQKLITAIKEIKERGSISESLFGVTAAEKVSTPEPTALHLCKTKKQENIYAKSYLSQTYLNSAFPEPSTRQVTEPKTDTNPYKKPYLSQTYLRRNHYAPITFARPRIVQNHRVHVRPKLFNTKRLTMGKMFILERLFAGSLCMPTPQKVTEWAAKLQLNRVEVMQWFRCKWRAKLEYEAETEEIRHDFDVFDPEHNFPDTLNICRQLQKFDLEKAYDIVLDPTTELDLITEGDFVIDFENDEDEQILNSDQNIQDLVDDTDDENIEIEYPDISATEE